MAEVILERFRINNEGIERIACGLEAKRIVREVAAKALAHAASIAPEGSGDYARSFKIRSHIRRDWPLHRPNPRACADLINDDPGAIAIEKGTARQTNDGRTVTTPAFRVLGKTLEHLAVQHAAGGPR